MTIDSANSDCTQDTIEELRNNLQEAKRIMYLMYHAMWGETGFASAVRNDTQLAYPWPAMDLAEEAYHKFLQTYGTENSRNDSHEISTAEPTQVLVISQDDFPVCPSCGKRLDLVDVIDENTIKTNCQTHGIFGVEIEREKEQIIDPRFKNLTPVKTQRAGFFSTALAINTFCSVSIPMGEKKLSNKSVDLLDKALDSIVSDGLKADIFFRE